MNRWQFYLVAAAAALALFVIPMSFAPMTFTNAQDGKDAPKANANVTPPAAPAAAPGPDYSSIIDPAFARYADIDLLIEAWEALDPALLSDMALQLAEGERVLLRSHKIGSSHDLLKLAVKVAVDKKDKAALDRLSAIAKATKKDDLLAQIASAAKLGGASRKDDPNRAVSVDDTSPDEFAFYSQFLRGIKTAELVGDAEAVQDIRDNLPKFPGLTDKQKEYLKKLAGETLSGMPKEAETNSVAASLRKLEGPARHDAAQIVDQVFRYIGQVTHGGRGYGYGHGGTGHGGFGHGGYGHGGFGHGGGYGHGGYYARGGSYYGGHGGFHGGHGSYYGGHGHGSYYGGHGSSYYGGHGFGGHGNTYRGVSYHGSSYARGTSFQGGFHGGTSYYRGTTYRGVVLY